MDSAVRKNLLVVLYRVGQIASIHDFYTVDVRRTANLCVCCVLTESAGWIYANENVPTSLGLYYQRLGQDHASVGLYQQQVPAWGTAEECMDPLRSTDKFVRALMRRNLHSVSSGVAPWDAIQEVQRSAFPDGSNYRAQRTKAARFVRHNWAWTGYPRLPQAVAAAVEDG